jgi:hypothetical protein
VSVLPPRTPANQVYVATETFVCEVEGAVHTITKGRTRVRAGHPVYVANPQYFEPVDAGVQYDVEQATADPGSKRGE